MSNKLFDNSDSESENENLTELKTNKEYAKVYNKFRQKELLKKLKDRGLNDSDDTEDSSESDDSSTDEDIHDPKFDEEFYKTLSSLKSKDPIIYDKNAKFFENYDGATKKENTVKKDRKALTLKDYERKVILEKGGIYEDDDDEENEQVKRPLSPSYMEEQEQLKKEFKKILNNNDEEEEEFGGIFKKRNKSKEEEEKEDKDFVEWLAGKKEEIDENKKEKLNPLKKYWNNPNLSKEEQFLRDYVLNNGYTNTTSGKIPTYEEIVADAENLSEDEEELEKQAEFENKFNFRFEEPDKEFIKRYPRTIESSVRKVDDKRKLKRLEVKERKQKEKEEKYQEIEMLKQLKLKEIQEKIQKLKEVTGNDELPFADNDLESDFDPDAHDRRMQEIFNDEYYQIEEDEEKPECPDIEELKVEDWDNYDPNQDDDNDDFGDDYYDDNNDNEPHCEDDDFVMDCDYEKTCKEETQNELIENTRSRRKRRRRRNRFMEMIKTKKPAFNPEDEKTYAEYIDEYYKIDCEDIIGDQPCRFKYVETVPNDFGLTMEEILLAKNKELNQWASLKKAVQIRPEHVERNEANLYKMKAQNWKLKKKIFRSLYGSSSEDEGEKEERDTGDGPKQNNKKDDSKAKDSVNKTDEDKKSVTTEKKKKQKKQLNGAQLKTDQKSDEKVDEDEANKITKVVDANDHTQKKKKNKNKNKVNTSESNNKKDKISHKKVESVAPSKLNKKRKNPFNSTKDGSPMNKKKKSFDSRNSNTTVMKLSDERLQAYGINPKKFHKKQKFMSNNQKFKNKKNN